MARIPVMNPPRKRKRRVVRRRKISFKRKTVRRKRRVSPASIAALRKYNAGRKKKHAHRKKRKAVRHKRRVKHFNPFGGELALIGNPARKSHRGKSSRRRKNMARHRRRRHHSIALRNPFSVGALMSKPKEILNKDFAIEAVAAAGGFVLPGIVMAKFPPNLVNSTVKYYGVKVGTVILLSVGAGFISKRASRIVLIGGVASILLDVWAMWQAAHAAPAAAPAPKSGTQVYYGPNISPYYGGMSDVGGYADDDTGMTMEDAAGEGF